QQPGRAADRRPSQVQLVVAAAPRDGQVLDARQVDLRLVIGHNAAIDRNDVRIGRAVDDQRIAGRRRTAIDVDRGGDACHEVDGNHIVIVATVDVHIHRESDGGRVHGDAVVSTKGVDVESGDVGVGGGDAVPGHGRRADNDVVDPVGGGDYKGILPGPAIDGPADHRCRGQPEVVRPCSANEILKTRKRNSADGATAASSDGPDRVRVWTDQRV